MLVADRPDPELHLVYNAAMTPSGLYRDLLELLGLREHRCRLCELTYRWYGKDRRWARFVGDLDVEATFHHSNLFRRRCPNAPDAELPCVYVERDTGIDVLIGAAEIDACETLGDLQAVVAARVEELMVDIGRR